MLMEAFSGLLSLWWGMPLRGVLSASAKPFSSLRIRQSRSPSVTVPTYSPVRRMMGMEL